jgi:hypothetical protein
MQQPPAPISERLRTVRSRVTIAVLATFVAAWLAVAAFGRGGGQSSGTAASTSPQAAPSDDSQFSGPAPSDGSQYSGPAPSDDGGQGSSSPAPSENSDPGSSSGPGPVTSSQS